jgi:bacterioferritin (cytochrome b1)
MTTDIQNISKFLRCELSAVHQQFVHILITRHWGARDIADRISEVDNVDFPNVMKVIDHLVGSRTTVQIAGDKFQPGHSIREVVKAELTMENRLVELIDNTSLSNESLSAFVEVAAHPRKSYLPWLEKQLEQLPIDENPKPDFAPETSTLLGNLLTVIEQTLFHAFVHDHDGNAERADFSWHTSGAAMMHLTKFVALFSAKQAAPVFRDMPALTISYDAPEALESDAEIAGKCAQLAGNAAHDSADARIKKFCLSLNDYYTELSESDSNKPHPAINSNPPAFSSFSATLNKFVRDS